MTPAPRREAVGRLLLALGVAVAVASVTVLSLSAYYALVGGRAVPAFFENARSLWWVTAPAAALAVAGALLRGRRRVPEDAPLAAPPSGLPRGALLLPLAYLALGAFHAFTTPLFEGPDEHSHFQMVQYLARTGRIPPLEEEPITIVERIQPPLYYAALAPLARRAGLHEIATLAHPNPDFLRRGGEDPANWIHGPDEAYPIAGDVLRIHLLRCAGLLFGAVAVILACAIGAEVFPASPRLALASGACVAFLPQFAHLGALFTNDVAAAAAGGAVLLLTLRLRRTPRASLALGAGAAVGVASLTKLSGLLLVPVVLLAAGLARTGRRGDRVRLPALVLLGFVATAGWYFAANAFFYGNPLENFALHQSLDPGGGSADFAPALKWGLLFPTVLFLSFFASFGSLTVVPSPGIVAVFALLLLAGVSGIARGGVRPRGRAILGVAVVLLLAAQVLFNRRVFQPQGRHLFLVLPAIAPLLVAGLASLWPRRHAVPLLGVGALLAAHVATALLDLRPSFRPPNALDDLHRAITNASERLPLDGTPIPVEGPDDGAVVVEAPRIRWEARPGETYEVQLSLDDPRFSRPNWDLLRPVLRFRAEGTFEFPVEEWASREAGTVVFWRVVRVSPARAASRGEGTLRASEARRVIRGAE